MVYNFLDKKPTGSGINSISNKYFANELPVYFSIKTIF